MKVEFWGQEFQVNMVVGCIGGFLIAVMSSMFGFGGGPFMVPLMTVALLGVLGGVMLESIPLAPKVNGTHIAKALLDGMRTVVDALAKAEREGGAS